MATAFAWAKSCGAAPTRRDRPDDFAHPAIGSPVRESPGAPGWPSPPPRRPAAKHRHRHKYVRFAIHTCSTPRERSVDARPVAIWPAPTTSTFAPSNVAEVLGGNGDRGRRDRHRDAGRCRFRCARACPIRPRGGTGPRVAARFLRAPRPPTPRGPGRGSRSRRRSSSRGRRRPRRGARPRLRRSTCRADRRSLRARRPSTSARNALDVADRGVEVRAPRVDLDAVARGEHDDLEQVLTRARDRRAPWRASCFGHRHPLEQRRRAPCGG